MRAPKPILCIGGWDPSGGAGLMADTQALNHIGYPASGLITTHTEQNLTHWFGAQPASPALFRSQFEALTQPGHSQPFSAIKIGALGSSEIATEVDMLLRSLKESDPDLPVVLDPVLQSSSGGTLGRMDWILPILPRVSLMCPNSQEWMQIQKHPLPQALAVLVTDAAPGAILLRNDNVAAKFTYTRLPGNWRGTGCRLSSLIAAYFAAGEELAPACEFALQTLHNWIQASAAVATHNSRAEVSDNTPQPWL